MQHSSLLHLSPDSCMIHDKSYGIVPLKKLKGEWHVLLVQHGAALYWGFPKGHAEKEESPQEAAIRELREETNLEVVRFFCETPLEEHYFFTWHGERVEKTVSFYIAVVKGKVKLQVEEIGGSKWVPLALGPDYLTYDTDKSICKNAKAIVVGSQ